MSDFTTEGPGLRSTPRSGLIHMTGDVFTTGCDVIGHGANTLGIMGAGFAKQVKERFPDVYIQYRDLCRSMADPHALLGHSQLVDPADPADPAIANLFTQARLGPHADIVAVRASLTELLSYQMDQHGYTSLALPRIGAGIGRLPWGDVERAIAEAAEAHPLFAIEIWTKSR